MAQITRVAIVGCGSIAQHAHIPGYASAKTGKRTKVS